MQNVTTNAEIIKKKSCQHLAIYSSTHHPLVLACKHRAHKEQCLLLLLHQQQQEHQEVFLDQVDLAHPAYLVQFNNDVNT
jgi:hypothetical protein